MLLYSSEFSLNNPMFPKYNMPETNVSIACSSDFSISIKYFCLITESEKIISKFTKNSKSINSFIESVAVVQILCLSGDSLIREIEILSWH